MRLHRRSRARLGGAPLRYIESLESRLLLDAAPVANDDQYSVLQDTVLSVNDQVPYPSPTSFPGLKQIQSIGVNYTVSQIEYSQPYNLLFAREGTTRVHVIDVTTGMQVGVHNARSYFIDFDLTPDGRFLYVSDRDGSTNYIHRFDADMRSWQSKRSPSNGYQIEGVDADHFLLNQSGTFGHTTLNHFGSTPAAPTTELSSVSADGDFEYDHRTSRVLHGSIGSSSDEIEVRAIVNGELVYKEETGTYGTAQGGGTTSVLSTDGKFFYYGPLQVSAANVRTNIHWFPESILASTAGLAFGGKTYYSAESGTAAGQLDHFSDTYGVSDHSNTVWTYDYTASRLRHYEIPHYPLKGVLTNDTDLDQDPLTALVVDGPDRGKLTLNSDGSFEYRPNPGFSGTDRFTYRVSDTTGRESNTASVTVMVRPSNVPPTAVNDEFLVEYQTPFLATRPQVNPFTFQGLTETVSLRAEYEVSQVEFAQHPGLLFIRDGSTAVWVIDTVSGLEVSHQPANEKFTDFDLTPDGRYLFVADYGGQEVTEGTPIRPSWIHRYDIQTRQWAVKQVPKIAYRVEAIDGDRFLLLEPAGAVELSLNHFGATLAEPVAELSRGDFSPAHHVSDIHYDHRAERVYQGNITLGKSNIAVVKVEADALEFEYDSGKLAVFANQTALSADGKYFFYGRLQVSPADMRQSQFILPEAILASTAGMAFTNNNIYSAETGEAIGSLGYPATVVTASDDGIHLLAYDGPEKRMLRIYQVKPLGWGVLANDIDHERDALTAELVSGPARGSLVFNSDGTFQYTPNDGYYGSDSFTYRASDGFGDSSVAKVNLTVASLPPTAQADSYTTSEDSKLDVPAAKGLLVNDSDPESQALMAVLVEGPRNGTLTLNEDGSFRYVPRADFFGSDSFTYQASDGASSSDATTVSLTVTGVPDAPVGTADSYTLFEDGKLSAAIGVLGNDFDPDGDQLTAILATQPTHGTLLFRADGWFGYVPAANFNGNDQFTYRSSDGTSQSEPITVTLTVIPVNDAPLANDDSFATDEDTPLTVAGSAGVLANDSDIDFDKLTAQLVVPPAHGTVALAVDGSFVYTPSANYHGLDVFSYRATDGQDGTVATVNIVVRPLPDAPRATDDTFTVQEDQILVVTLADSVLKNDSDPDGDVLTAVLVAAPEHGELTFRNDGTFVYTPAPNYFGSDSFTYRISDGERNSPPATVSITVASVNDLPVAEDDSYMARGSLTIDAAQGLLADDRDSDHATLTAIIVTQPQHGQLTLKADGSFTYIPGPSFSFTDSFTYRASDGIAHSNIATVRIEASLGLTTQNVTLISSEDGPVEGFFDVVVHVAANAGLSTAAYEVSLGVPSGRGIELTGALMAAESPLFAGQAPVFTVVSNQLLVTDVSALGPIALRDGARLFRVSFRAAPAAVGTIPVLFDAQFTTLSDDKGSSLPLPRPSGGSITVIDGISPKVESVLVGGAGWSASFVDYLAAQRLGSGGYQVSDDRAEPAILPWTGLNRVLIRFSEDVQVDRDDLKLLGINQASYAFAGMTYDATSHMATWTLGAPLAADMLRITLDGSSASAVRDHAGNLLDGNPAQDAAGDYHLQFSVMPGDVDQNGMTNVLDTVKTRNLQFSRSGDDRYSVLHDVDGSGSIGILDTIQVRNNQFSRLPQGQPNAASNFSPSLPLQGPVPATPPAVRIMTESVTITSQPGMAVEGVFDVFLQLMDGADVSVAGYDVALLVPAPGSGVTFVSAGLASTAHPPVFPSEPTDFTSPELLGVTDALPTGAAPLTHNGGLFSVRFTVAPGAGGSVPLMFHTSFTNLADGSGSPVAVDLEPGTITIIPPPTTIAGTSGDDQYHILRSGSQLLIYENTPPTGEPTYTIDLTANTLIIDAGDGNDTLTVDPGAEAALGLHRLVYTAGAGNNTLLLASGSARIDSTATGGTLDTTVSEGSHLSTTQLKQNGLSLAENSRVTLLPDNNTSVVTSLTLGTGATFDFGNNAVVIDYTGDSPAAAIREHIISGRGTTGLDATWTGTGITSSTAAAGNATEPESRSVGYAENAALPLGPYTSFRGQAVDNTAVLIAYVRTGDANLDGLVDDSDVTVLGATFAPATANANWALGDFDYNGFVEDNDATLLGAFYSQFADPLSTPFERLIDQLATVIASEIAVASSGHDGRLNQRRTSGTLDSVWSETLWS